MYSFEQLKIFVCVCQCGSFSAAARQLGRVQSGVSQAIANLEIAINQPLFTRSGNATQITEAGQLLLPIAQSILDQKRYFDQKVESIDRQLEQQLVLAVDESLLEPSLMAILSQLAERFPITDVELIGVPTFDVEQLVREKRAQLGLLYADGELKVDMDFVTLGQRRFVTVAAPQHPLAQLTQVTDADLTSQRQLVHRSSDGKELWFSYRISSRCWYANSHQALIDMAAAGVGWAVVPATQVQPMLATGRLVQLPVSHEDRGWLTTCGCVISRSYTRGPVLEALLTLLQQHYSDSHH
ncbi:LysR family transcriptional regulator [Ferrimonas senticii]|uniref:LysR family transcriptional regulator n=1 Tax=Ferrimonas senticii TaxID=394566 RepID=UPI00047FE955|nr:LysR family transcriptional regulator [Ferrimonas senticii]